MKKLLTILVSILMVLSLTACGNNNTDPVETPNPTDTTEVTEGQKLGLGSVTSISLNNKTEDKEASAQYNTTYAMVVLNADGTIAEVKVDVAQNTVGFAGEVSENTPTKLEKKYDYGMKDASSLEKGEWFEQIAAFEAWCVGKTVEEIKGAELGTTGNGHGGAVVELATSCTMTATDFIAAIEKAAANTVDANGATSFGFASVTALKSAAATEDKAASNQADTTYVAVAKDGDTVKAVIVDVAQNKAACDAEGTVTGEAAPTKLEKKYDYGMKDSSSLEKGEWFEQIEAFDAWCVGKTAAEITGAELGTTGNGHGGAVVELETSCTMTATDFIAAIEKACK